MFPEGTAKHVAFTTATKITSPKSKKVGAITVQAGKMKRKMTKGWGPHDDCPRELAQPDKRRARNSSLSNGLPNVHQMCAFWMRDPGLKPEQARTGDCKEGCLSSGGIFTFQIHRERKAGPS